MSVRRLAEQQPPSFAFTPENKAWADKLIAKYPKGRQASAVIPLLWRAQEQHDYWLPKAAIEAVADMLGMNRLRVLEVATFYTMFNLAPVGRHFIQLCGTPPCHVRGAPQLRKILERRIGPQQHVSADGAFSWLEVECLGACCNAPMAQINNDYYEDLTEENFLLLLDDLAAGRTVKKGSQTGRISSEPTPGKGTTLADPTLYDGSRVGAWKKRFEEEQARQAAAAAEAAAAKEAASAAQQAPTDAAKPARPAAVTEEATLASAPAAAKAAAAAAPAASGAAASTPTHEAKERSVDPGVTALAAGAADPAAAAREAQAAQEEAEIKAKLATLSKDATPQQKADAVGARPAGLTAARGGVADDLKRIKGVGKVNEGKLNELGVFHFDQIAAWTRPEIRWVGTYLAFPGRIDREDWTGQAKLLAQGLETEFSRRVDRGEVSTSTGGPSRPDKTK
ncbi:MAG: NADH-quinone oxidoreductase subunit NuoE [Methylobacteriaceae bacterium]|nr:NADH-quinone oxidoreductase subunit NuoE [Methylobacteriaceae bacterium]